MKSENAQFDWLKTHTLLLSTFRFSKQKKFKMDDKASISGYKKPQCKKFLTTDEVLTALFDSDNDSDGSVLIVKPLLVRNS